MNNNPNYNDPMFANRKQIESQSACTSCQRCSGTGYFYENGAQYPCPHDNIAYTGYYPPRAQPINLNKKCADGKHCSRCGHCHLHCCPC